MSFYESNSNPATATSGQIGEYIANARKKARNIKAFSSYKISSQTFNKPTIINILMSLQHKSQLITYLSKDKMLHGCKLGMDSHADISCVGKHGCVLEVIKGQTSIVRPFNDKYKPLLHVQTVNAAFAVDAINGDTYILHVNQCLNFKSSIENSILCTNQAQFHSTIVNNVPNLFQQNSTQSIIIPTHENLESPLQMNNPVSYLSVRYPTNWDMNNFPHIHLTDASAEWKPEELFNISSIVSTNTELTYIDSSLTTYNDTIMIHGVCKLSDVKSLTPEYLSTLWCITLEDAKITIQATT